MFLPPPSTHPAGEVSFPDKKPLCKAIKVDTFGGKVQIEWDGSAAFTPLGQLPYFIEFLKLGGRFEPWVADCPLHYTSNNAPKRVNVLGSLLLSVLSGHNRYAHLTALRGDTANTRLLGMDKIVSDSSAINALKRMDETAAIDWLQTHLHQCYEPLLAYPWILDVDVTVKPLYGHQEGAKLGYNPHKPGRPSHTYHSYLMANTRLVLEVDVQAGNQSASSYSMPGLVALLQRLPQASRPAFVRGDCDWGNDAIMTELEGLKQPYLFKVKRTKGVKQLIAKVHGQGKWQRFDDGWEVRESVLSLHNWKQSRRAVVIRRRLQGDPVLALSQKAGGQQEIAFVDGPEDMRLYEYSVLVTSLPDNLIALMQHYRDRADCENVFDEIKNQWGWGGFVTRQLQTSQIMARMGALIYNWWNLFTRLAIPEKHHEAITSRPLLLSSIGRLTRSGRQQQMTITSTHAEQGKIRAAYERIQGFFQGLKLTATQLTIPEIWQQIVLKCVEHFLNPSGKKQLLSQPTLS
ncbi:MAG: Transposase [uncultured Thiotrichaceae bacterium]|uniref:Transposase n=1 Tax=uncultured Thiotrichaceae bacterium TaxID=298394 RepID=A0A6S6SKR4_9GAMM|nr:MAG: Transposase [uncultured Thiotrichaceae bacterium]